MKKRIALIAAAILAVSALSACTAPAAGNAGSADTAASEAAVEAVTEEAAETVTEAAEEAEEVTEEAAEAVTTDVPKSEQTGTAGSNIPLKDNLEGAKELIVAALQAKIAEAYGDKVDDAVITIDKVYSTEDEQAFEPVGSMGLGMNEVAFEATMDLHPAEGADYNELLIPNGEYDEESGWVKNVMRLGVLRRNPDSDDPKYIITDFGTGW